MSFLFDEWPAGEAHRPASGPDATLPILQAVVKEDSGVKVLPADNGEPEPSESGNKRLVWGLATALLVLVTIANIAWTFRLQLLSAPVI
ncbi:MAG: hypothetical protein WBS20_03575, partial [Lysobacterales bacterium]